MRGKLQSQFQNIFHLRITPADAGKTVIPANIDDFVKDHPRGCGENSSCVEGRKQATGSPPRMRGKLTFIGYDETATRITPADAGKTGNIPFIFGTKGDHPRGCGENNF